MAPVLFLVPPLKDQPLTQNDRVTLAWSRFFDQLYLLAGGSSVPVSSPVVIRQIGGGFLGAFDAISGDQIGVIPLVNQPGGLTQVVVITGSPQVYHAVSDGTLVVFGAAVELSRDGGVAWFQVTLQGGAIPMKAQDRARMTWYSVDPPTITWFPTYDT